MLIMFIAIIIEALVSFLLKDILVDLELLSLIFIAINSIVILFVLANTVKEKKYFYLIYIGYAVRLAALFFDIYGRGVFVLPHSGSDTEGFYLQGHLIADDPSLFGELPMGAYADFLGLFIYIFGDQRILAQYINTLLGVGVIIFIYKTLSMLEVKNKNRQIIIILIVFFPQAIIFSGILLRENLVSFAMMSMIFYFIKWYKQGGKGNAFLSIISLGVAAYFHSGVVGAFLPLAFMLTFYKVKSKKLHIDTKALVLFVMFSISLITLYMLFGDVFFSKFGGNNMDLSSDSLSKTIEGIDAGSKYLEWLSIDNYFEIILFAPLKMFYFLYSPIPLDWRGIIDIITFFMDSLVYFILSIYIIRNRKKNTGDYILLNALITIFLFVTFTFAYGTFTAGTAVRHRNKIFGLLLVIFAMIAKKKKTL